MRGAVPHGDRRLEGGAQTVTFGSSGASPTSASGTQLTFGGEADSTCACVRARARCCLRAAVPEAPARALHGEEEPGLAPLKGLQPANQRPLA